MAMSDEFKANMKEMFADINLSNHDNMKVAYQVCASRRGETYTDEDHEALRQKLKDELAQARANPLFSQSPYC